MKYKRQKMLSRDMNARHTEWFGHSDNITLPIWLIDILFCTIDDAIPIKYYAD